MRAARYRNVLREKSLRHTHRNIPEVTKTPKEMRTTVVGDMLPSVEGGETAARAIISPALLRRGDMVVVVRVEGGFQGFVLHFGCDPRCVQ
jgi:hypothetical protein